MAKFQNSIRRGTVNYHEFGNPDQPTVLCLHGLGGNGLYSFGELIPYLCKDFHVIILDNPGHGKTAPLPKEEDYLFSNLAAWVDQVVDRIIDGPFYIMGHSWGADIALHYTRFYPDNIAGLILLDGAFTFPHNQPEMSFDYAYTGWNDYMDRSIFNSEEEIFEEYRIYARQWDIQKERYAASLFTKTPDGKFELIVSKFSVLAIVKAFFKEPFREAYPFIKAPTLLIHAAHPKSLEQARIEGVRQLSEHIENLSVQSLENAMHMIQWDEPEMTSHSIIQWLNKT